MLEELRSAFNELDADGGGSLCESELAKLLKLLDVTLESDLQFQVAFHTLDRDNSGALEYPEFLHLLKAVRDQQGPLKPMRTPVTSLSCLDASDLLTVLLALNLSWEEAAGLNESERLKTVSSLLNL